MRAAAAPYYFGVRPFLYLVSLETRLATEQLVGYYGRTHCNMRLPTALKLSRSGCGSGRFQCGLAVVASHDARRSHQLAVRYHEHSDVTA